MILVVVMEELHDVIDDFISRFQKIFFGYRHVDEIFRRIILDILHDFLQLEVQ